MRGQELRVSQRVYNRADAILWLMVANPLLKPTFRKTEELSK